jgi:hypothetical protein
MGAHSLESRRGTPVKLYSCSANQRLSFILFGEELMTSNWLVRSPFADEVLHTPVEA